MASNGDATKFQRDLGWRWVQWLAAALLTIATGMGGTAIKVGTENAKAISRINLWIEHGDRFTQEEGNALRAHVDQQDAELRQGIVRIETALGRLPESFPSSDYRQYLDAQFADLRTQISLLREEVKDIKKGK